MHQPTGGSPAGTTNPHVLGCLGRRPAAAHCSSCLHIYGLLPVLRLCLTLALPDVSWLQVRVELSDEQRELYKAVLGRNYEALVGESTNMLTLHLHNCSTCPMQCRLMGQQQQGKKTITLLLYLCLKVAAHPAAAPSGDCSLLSQGGKLLIVLPCPGLVFPCIRVRASGCVRSQRQVPGCCAAAQRDDGASQGGQPPCAAGAGARLSCIHAGSGGTQGAGCCCCAEGERWVELWVGMGQRIGSSGCILSTNVY